MIFFDYFVIAICGLLLGVGLAGLINYIIERVC